MTIPNFLKIKVLEEYLTGLKREEIAKNNGISTGSVSMIIDEFRKDVPDLDKLREMSIQINNTGYGINDFFSAIRHNNHIKKLGLTEEKAEEIIETMHEYSFKNGMTIQLLFDIVLYIYRAEYEMGISIKELPQYIVIKTNDIDTLQHKIIDEDKKFRDLCRYYKVKQEDLDDFIKLKPLHESLKNMTDQLLLEIQHNYELTKENKHQREELEELKEELKEKNRIIEFLRQKINNSRRNDDDDDDDDEVEYSNSDKTELDNQDE